MQSDILKLIQSSMQPSTYTEDAAEAISASVVFRLDRDRVLVQRIVYNMLDFLGDIGGLYGAFNGVATVLCLVLNFNGEYHLLTSSLFSVQTKVAKDVPIEAPNDHMSQIAQSIIS